MVGSNIISPFSNIAQVTDNKVEWSGIPASIKANDTALIIVEIIYLFYVKDLKI